MNALRQFLDEVDAGCFPGLHLLVTGTAAFFDGPQGVQRLPPLAQRLHIDFTTDARFDNPRAVQIRLPPFTLERLHEVGRKVRDIYASRSPEAERIRLIVNDAYIAQLAEAVTGRLGGRVGIVPRLFLKKLVADVLDRVEQFPDFDPQRHYALTLVEHEMTPVERGASGATNVDDIDLNT
jgi:hypothetical protein